MIRDEYCWEASSSLDVKNIVLVYYVHKLYENGTSGNIVDKLKSILIPALSGKLDIILQAICEVTKSNERSAQLTKQVQVQRESHPSNQV